MPKKICHTTSRHARVWLDDLPYKDDSIIGHSEQPRGRIPFYLGKSGPHAQFRHNCTFVKSPPFSFDAHAHEISIPVAIFTPAQRYRIHFPRRSKSDGRLLGSPRDAYSNVELRGTIVPGALYLGLGIGLHCSECKSMVREQLAAAG